MAVWLAAVWLAACAGVDSTSPRIGIDPADSGPPPGLQPGTLTPLPNPDALGERTFTLNLDLRPPPPLALDMNRDEVQELLGDIAPEIVMLELDPYPLLVNTLDTIKAACGTDWRDDDPDPRLDCELTDLGRSFARDGMGWRESPEYALVRLLTMTPANVVVLGTSIEFLQSVSDLVGIGGGFGQMLADSLRLRRTEEFLDSRVLAVALKERFIGSHPNIGPNGGILFTLEDALGDLEPLAQKLGPVGGHPGILAPDFLPHGVVMGDEMRMRVVAESNIRIFEGVSLQQGTGQINVLRDAVGPTFDDPLEFDFESPAGFEVTGLTDRPVMDLRLRIRETDDFVPACSGDEYCQSNLPESPVGETSVWARPPFTLEHIIAAGGFNQYSNLTNLTSYLGDLATVESGQDGAPPGWIHFGVPLNLGPKDQYAWELILEVGQVSLHGPDGRDLLEGAANVEFTVYDVPVGITGEQCARSVRPYLQQQRARISESLLGDFRSRNDALDFYLAALDDGRIALFFIAREDLGDGQAYPWRSPGFYLDAALTPTQKSSLLVMAGSTDVTHEKLVVFEEEQTVYIEDAKGAVFRLRLHQDRSDPLRPHRVVVASKRVGP